MRLFAVEQSLHDLYYTRDSGRTADKNYFVDFIRGQARIAQCLLHRTDRALKQIFHQLFELRTSQFQLQVLRSRRIRSDEGKIDFRLHQLGQLDLGFFRSFLQPLDRHAVFAQINALLFLELGHDPLDDSLVDVITAQMRVAVGGFHFDNSFAHFENGDVKRSAAQVINGNGLVLFLVEAIS